jgi:ribosome-binding factor A
LLQETLAELISTELSDPRLEMLSITGVTVSPDLAYATATISTLAGGAATDAAVAVLNKAAPLLWNRLRAATDLRSVPQLRFVVDRGGEYMDEVAALLRQVPPPALEEPADDAASDAGSRSEDEA